MKKVIAFILIAYVIVGITIPIVKSVQLDQNCTGYLERAATANTIESAQEQLQIGIKYLEENRITSGYTSVFYKTPDEDISFWYQNLKKSEEELSKLTDNSTQLEKSNTLLKLRESLIKNKDGKDVLVVPDGLAYYPNNFSYGLLFWSAIILIFVLIIWAAIELNDN